MKRHYCDGCEYADIKLKVVPKSVKIGYYFVNEPKIEEFIWCKKKFRNIQKPFEKCKERASKKRNYIDSY